MARSRAAKYLRCRYFPPMQDTIQSGLTRPAVSTRQSDELSRTGAPQAFTSRSGTPQRRHTTGHPAPAHQRPQPRVQRPRRSTTPWEGPFNLSAGHAGHGFWGCGLEPIQAGSSEDDHLDSSDARPADRCTKRAWHHTGPRGPSHQL